MYIIACTKMIFYLLKEQVTKIGFWQKKIQKQKKSKKINNTHLLIMRDQINPCYQLDYSALSEEQQRCAKYREKNGNKKKRHREVSSSLCRIDFTAFQSSQFVFSMYQGHLNGVHFQQLKKTFSRGGSQSSPQQTINAQAAGR